DLVAATGAFSPDLFAALWELVWAGEVTNDTFAPLRSRLRGGPGTEAGRSGADRSRRDARRLGRQLRGGFRPRRAGPPGSEGRWSMIFRGARVRPASETERRAALTSMLLDRHGVLTREAVHAEGIGGGFSAVYDVLKAMEEAGRVRRGYFI